MKELDDIMELNPRVLLEGMRWEKSDVALRKLKQMLWGFEALRTFSDQLKKAIEEIGNAGEKMKAWLKKDEAVRHKDMVSGIEQVKEEFEKRHSRLENAHSSLQQRIDQGIKLSDGISSVLSVEQNENISKLTWLTIIYLAPSFLTGLFGMDRDIVPKSEGLRTFMWLLVTLVAATVLFALCLRFILEQFRRLWGTIAQALWPTPTRKPRTVPQPARRTPEGSGHHAQQELGPNEVDVESGATLCEVDSH
jgi:hypothetical protein